MSSLLYGKNRRGMSLGDLVPAGIAFVFVAIIISIGADVVSDVGDDAVTNTAGCNATVKTSCGIDYNTTVQGTDALNELSSWLPTIGLVIAAAVVIGVLAFLRTR